MVSLEFCFPRALVYLPWKTGQAGGLALFTWTMFSLFSPCSTVAASINALATVTFEDFVKSCFPHLSDKLSTWISKGLCRYSQGIFIPCHEMYMWYMSKSCTCYSGHMRNLTISHTDSYTCKDTGRVPASLPFTILIFDLLLCLAYISDSSHQHLLIMLCIVHISSSTWKDILLTVASPFLKSNSFLKNPLLLNSQ